MALYMEDFITGRTLSLSVSTPGHVCSPSKSELPGSGVFSCYDSWLGVCIPQRIMPRVISHAVPIII